MRKVVEHTSRATIEVAPTATDIEALKVTVVINAMNSALEWGRRIVVIHHGTTEIIITMALPIVMIGLQNQSQIVMVITATERNLKNPTQVWMHSGIRPCFLSDGRMKKVYLVEAKDKLDPVVLLKTIT